MKRLQLLFIVLTTYILLQFGWWAYMLITLNNEVYENKVELVHLHGNSNEALLKSDLEKKLRSKWWMIAGEGFVFIGLLSYGIYQTFLAFKKEYALAKMQKNFLLSVTHEFKSPLAAVKLNIQTLAKHKLSAEQTKGIIESTLSETDRLNDLVENALTAARIDTHSFSLVYSQINLSNLVQSIVQMKQMTDNGYRKVKCNIQDNVMVLGDDMALSSVVLNLIENAIKYSFDNVDVLISLQQQNENAILKIADKGIGMKQSEREKVFEKFFRIGNEETRNTKGTGLGLYIVKNIVELHKGSISVTDNVPQGCVFTVTLPCK
ncbi:MAG TPA: HAMP domain-containing sensor histidine kinase [Bacteroidia bacterium]|nr:HAMP domain-containing sensor histidine kinase [Bacteroidia bacterium]